MSETLSRRTPIVVELFDIAAELIADGFTVYYLPDGRALTTWIIFGKPDDNGNVWTGTVERDYFVGINVNASIVPSRENGSSMALWHGDWPRQLYSSVLEACRAAAMPTVQNDFQPRLANHGIKHFDWCADQLVHLVA